VFEAYAIRYATVERRTPENFLIQDVHDGPMPMDYFIWVVRNAERTILIDTGFGHAAAAARKRNLLIDPAEALVKFGLPPDRVEDVIVTHLHYDHAGRIDAFPNARFHLQDAEISHATGRCMCHPILRHPYAVEDIVGMVRRLYEGRVVFHRGDSDFGGGITLHAVPGHTPGLQVVRVPTARGHIVIASDASHFTANMELKNPFPIVVDVGAMLEGHRRLRELADSPAHIVPGHDPAVCRIYPRLDISGAEVFALHRPPAV